MRILKGEQVICENAFYANNVMSRLVGLLGKKSFGGWDGLLLYPCSQIHSVGMKFSFDAVYLDKNMKIVSLYENIGKNKILPYNVVVKHVLELPCGTISNKKLVVDDVLQVIKER